MGRRVVHKQSGQNDQTLDLLSGIVNLVRGRAIKYVPLLKRLESFSWPHRLKKGKSKLRIISRVAPHPTISEEITQPEFLDESEVVRAPKDEWRPGDKVAS